MRRSYTGHAQTTTLTAPISNSDLSMTVADGSTLPDGTNGPFVITLDLLVTGEEKVLCASRTGNNIVISSRGYDGTSATSHASGASVRHTISAVDLDEANAHLNDTARDDHTQYALVKKGLAALRGAAGRSMKFHLGIDSGLLAVDDGTTWHEFQDKTSADAAYLAKTATFAICSFAATTLTTAGPAFCSPAMVAQAGGFTIPGGTPTRLVVPTAGLYRVKFQVGVNTTTGILLVQVRKSTAPALSGATPTLTGTATTHACEGLVQMTAGEYLEFVATPGNGTAANPVTVSDSTYTRADIAYIGA